VGVSTSIQKENLVISFARQLWMSYLMCYAAWIYFYLFISEEVRQDITYVSTSGFDKSVPQPSNELSPRQQYGEECW